MANSPDYLLYALHHALLALPSLNTHTIPHCPVTDCQCDLQICLQHFSVSISVKPVTNI